MTRATATESLARDALPISQLRHAWQELSDELESLKRVALVHPDFDGWQRDMKKRKQVFRVVEKRLKERRRLAQTRGGADGRECDAAEPAAGVGRGRQLALQQEESGAGDAHPGDRDGRRGRGALRALAADGAAPGRHGVR